MDVVNLIYGLGDEFGMLISATWSGELYKRVLESGEVFISIIPAVFVFKFKRLSALIAKCESESVTVVI